MLSSVQVKESELLSPSIIFDVGLFAFETSASVSARFTVILEA